MDSDEQSALLGPRHSQQGQGAAAGSAGYASIVGVESADVRDSSERRFRAREYARLRRVVLFVTGLTTVLIGAGLLVGLLVPVTLATEPDVVPALVILPVP